MKEIKTLEDRKKELVDTLAATYILETYINMKKNI